MAWDSGGLCRRGIDGWNVVMYSIYYDRSNKLTNSKCKD